jgi:hypothetical protein
MSKIMPNNPSAMQVEEETGKQRSSMDYDDDLEAILAEIVKPGIARTSIDDENGPSSGGFMIIDGLPTPQASRGEIATIGYAPLEMGGEEMRNLDLDFSAGGEIAPFQAEYLPSSQELLRQIQAGGANPSDSFGIHGSSTAAIGPKRQYLTKLQFGSVIGASLLAGAAIYIALNPSILAPLTNTQVATLVPTTATNLGQSIQAPNLATNEFTELNLSTVGTIPIPATSPTQNGATTSDSVVNLTEVSPVAIPFNPTFEAIPPTGTVVRGNLSDSLIKSLLPPNFRSNAKPVVKQRGVGKKQ